MLSPEEAFARIQAAVIPVSTEVMGYSDSFGRVLARDVVATTRHPSHDNSAMDGYAVCSGDGSTQSETSRLRVVGRSRCGKPFDGRMSPGTAVRIFTGALIPDGADAVVIQENVTSEARDATQDDGYDIEFSTTVSPGLNVRKAGENYQPGDVLLSAGTVIGPAAVGLLASARALQVEVFRRPRVAILGTGDEVTSPEMATGAPGEIVDGNGPMLQAAACSLGAEVIYQERCGDDPKEQLDWFAKAVLEADVVLTTGGASVGDHDLIADVWEHHGIETDFWKVAMKPGKPLRFGRAIRADGGVCLVFALPGNPLSAWTGFQLFGAPALRRMMGHEAVRPFGVRLPITREMKKRPGRAHFVRGRVVLSSEGYAFEPATRQGSAMLRAAASQSWLGELPADASNVPMGTEICVWHPDSGIRDMHPGPEQTGSGSKENA